MIKEVDAAIGSFLLLEVGGGRVGGAGWILCPAVLFPTTLPTPCVDVLVPEGVQL